MPPCVKDATQRKNRRIHEKFRLKNEFAQVVVKSKKGQKLTIPKNVKFLQKIILVLGKRPNWPNNLYIGTL